MSNFDEFFKILNESYDESAESSKLKPISALRSKFKIEEDVESSMPAAPLNYDELYQAIVDTKNGTYVNVGYLKEIAPAAKYKAGGRGHQEGDPVVRIFKATEVYGRVGVDRQNIQAYKDRVAAEREAGIERRAASYQVESEYENKIFIMPTGNKCLQIFPRSLSDLKSRWFISIDGGDLVPTSKAEVAQYCTASAIGSSNADKPFSADTPLRLNLAKIYYYKDLGDSLM